MTRLTLALSALTLTFSLSGCDAGRTARNLHAPETPSATARSATQVLGAEDDFVHGCDTDEPGVADLICVENSWRDVLDAVDDCARSHGLSEAVLDANDAGMWDDTYRAPGTAALAHLGASRAAWEAIQDAQLPCRVTTVETEVAHALLSEVWGLAACD